MVKKVWIMNHYASSMYFDKGGRHYSIAKYLKRNGYDPVIFCCNAKHGKNEKYIDSKNLFVEKHENDIDVPFVFVRGRTYDSNGKDRILNMFDFFFNVQRTAIRYAIKNGKPDVIYASSVHPLTLVAGIILSKIFRVKCICEIRDLWPESIVAYSNKLTKGNSIIKVLYLGEKWIYKHADKLVFLMEGAYGYIKNQNWEECIPKSKVSIINNGIDLDLFDIQKNKYVVEDEDLEDDSTYKIIYAGSLRRANDQIYMLFDAIELMQGDEYRNIRFLIYGKGELEEELNDRIKNKGLNNVKMKGFVEKKYMPYILSKCDLNILNCKANKILKYGGSQNKLFEYLASGHSIISGEDSQYSIVKKYECGISKSFTSANDLVESISYLYKNPVSYEKIRNVAEQYTYDNLVNELEKLF